MSYISPTDALPLLRGPRAFVSPARYTTKYTARLARSDRFREDAYRLRHDSYCDGGYLDPRPDGLFEDEYDGAPNQHLIVVYADDVPVASVRVCFMSRDDGVKVPIRSVFPDEVRGLLEATEPGRGDFEGAELNRLVRSPAAANNQGLVFLLYRLAGYLLLMHNVQVIMSCVRRNHIPFYKRLGCYEAADARAYPGLKCAMHMLACPRPDYDRVRKVFTMMNPEAGAPDSFDGFLDGRAIVLPLLDNRGG